SGRPISESSSSMRTLSTPDARRFGAWCFKTANLSPTLERHPDSALEPKAVDRHRRIQRANAAETNAGPLEAAFLEHATRARIGHARAGRQRAIVEIDEREIDERAHRLDGKSLSPMRHAKPVTDLRLATLGRLDTAIADQRSVMKRDAEIRTTAFAD